METNITLPSKNGTDKILHNKKVSTTKEEPQELDFIDNFLSVLITNMNPSDLSLDLQTSDKLSKLIDSNPDGNKDLSNIDLKQFISSLKSELANGKPHQLSLEAMKVTVSNLLANQNISFQDDFLNGKSTAVIGTLLENVSEDKKSFDSIITSQGETDDSTEKLLLNLRKFLSNDEYNSIKNNLQPSIAKKNIEVSPKVDAINRFISVITGKELDAKSKIVSKSNNISLESESKPVSLNNSIKSEFTISSQKTESSELLHTINEPITGQKVAFETLSKVVVDSNTVTLSIEDKQFISVEKEIKPELNKNISIIGSDGELSQEFGKQQNKDSLKQRIAKSDISELLGKSVTKKSELTKTENIAKSDFVEKAIKNIKLTKSGGTNIARIMLNPRSLGDITLRITLIGNSVKLYVKADKSEAAEHLERQLPLLKERMAESGLRVEQVIIESSESDHLKNNQERNSKNEQEELRRQFVKSFGKTAKEEFDISKLDVANYNSSPFSGYTKAGSKINV